MRTLTTTKEVYRFEELSHSAKQNALYQFQCNDTYPSNVENKEVLEAFTNIFPVKVKDWEYGSYRNDHISFSFTADDDIENLSGVRLATYIYNNYFHDLFKGKFYYKKYYFKSRKSKVFFDNCCPLTGYYIDMEMLDPVYDFLKKPTNGITFYDLMEECLNNWVSACTKDMEGYYSEENLKEAAEANNWEFYEDGTLI